MSLPQPLRGLAEYEQFIIYKLVQRPTGKMDKLPLSPHTLEPASAHAPTNWLSADDATAMAQELGHPYGVGFVFTAADPFFFVDIDDCLEGNGKWSTFAQELMGTFTGACVEVSQSGRGLHIIGSGSHAAPAHRCKDTRLHLEFYTQERFVALTGTNAIGNVLQDCSPALAHFVEQYMPKEETLPGEVMGSAWTSDPAPEWDGPEDDDELIERALRSVSGGAAFGGRASFRDLWEGNAEVLAEAYPVQGGDGEYDASSADRALAQHLAFWTGKNCERIMRLMYRSALVRDKWERPDYLRERTIPSAVRSQMEVYGSRKVALTRGDDEPIPDGHHDPETGLTAGHQYLSPRQQLEYFKGCVYIRDQHRVFVPDGAMLKPEQFKASYGGYVFALDATGTKTTKSAWEVFTESQAARFPSAMTSGFRPDRPSGEIRTQEGQSVVNTYVPIQTECREGDAEPFFTFFERFLPDERDRLILWSYMSALVQYPGTKFQWWPFLQGAEGNGKTLIFRVVEHAVGQRYTHYPNALDIANPFNAWLMNKLFIGVEEVFIGPKREIMEALKPIITNNRIDIQRKGADQFTGDNYANGMAASNYKDALIITLDTRRWAAFYTAQQCAEDLRRDDMHGSFFPKLYDWLRHGGYAVLNQQLRNFEIPNELNPAIMDRAPRTSSTHEAVAESRGTVEQEIQEAIEQERPGFRGGWISSAALNDFMERKKIAHLVPHRRRRDLLKTLGYDWHPSLVPYQGRAQTAIAAEGGTKPKLFIREGHQSLHLKPTPSEVVQDYIYAQGYLAVAGGF